MSMVLSSKYLHWAYMPNSQFRSISFKIILLKTDGRYPKL